MSPHLEINSKPSLVRTEILAGFVHTDCHHHRWIVRLGHQRLWCWSSERKQQRLMSVMSITKHQYYLARNTKEVQCVDLFQNSALVPLLLIKLILEHVDSRLQSIT